MDEQYPQEEEQQGEEGGMADMVRQQSMMPTGFDPSMTESQRSASMGFSPWAHVGKNSETAAYNKALQQQSGISARRQAPDPRMRPSSMLALETMVPSKHS